MPFRQQIFAILISIGIFVIIIELVRKRKLREEYSWLWLLTGLILFILAAWHDLLLAITYFIGAALATSTLFFFGLVFLILINIYYSIKISTITNQMKDLAQEIGILKAEVKSRESGVGSQESKDSDTVKK
jgi:predicted membrane channel-forming protein YqfA (hemolysin III family)